jgi:2-amino-4-hydroxy-6-hydroxymethyldihydropteridine diphosphokinase
MGRLILLLGGNEGNVCETFQLVCSELAHSLGPILEVSAFYESEAWGYESEFKFVNQVVELSSDLSPNEVLTKTRVIEKKFGRSCKTNKGYQDRKIDIDILYYDDQIIQTTDLTIPHPRLHLRRFTLLPLAEKWGDFIHPQLQKCNRELLNSCTDYSVVTKLP